MAEFCSNDSLSSRERVRRTFNREDVDRVPRFETFWEDTLKAWEAQGLAGGGEQVLEMLGADLAAVNGWDTVWPAPFAGATVLEKKNNTVLIRDEWGATIRQFTDHQTTPEHVGWECDSPDIWRKTFLPRLQEAPSLDGASIRKWSAHANRKAFWRFLIAVEPFECLRKLVGDEEMLMGILEEPEWIAEMAEVLTTRSLKMLTGIREAAGEVEGLWIYGDMAFNHSTMCSPRHYRELIWPQHRRLCEWAHQQGAKVIYHTDGKVDGVLSDYVEAGIDMLQPLESKAGMDLRRLQPEWGEQLAFFGNVDVMSMISNDLEMIEAEIAGKMEAGKSKKNYIYHSDHSIPPQVSWETYQAIIRMVEKHGQY